MAKPKFNSECQRIAARNIRNAFIWIVGGYYNSIQEGMESCVPDTAEEVKREIYESALENKYTGESEIFGKPPKEMRFAGEEFCKEYINDLWEGDSDVEEIAEAKGWSKKRITEEQAKEIIEQLKPLQETQEKNGYIFPCPRCGHKKMRSRAVRNALSRHADVYICSDCGMDEAIRDMTGEVLPFAEWGIVL